MKREIAKEWCAYRRRPVDEGTATVTPVSPEEIDAALKNMKCGFIYIILQQLVSHSFNFIISS